MGKYPRHSRDRSWLPGWFKVSLLVLAMPIVLKLLQVQVFVEVSHDGVSYLAGLTEAKTYLIPLGLLLVYILGGWAWKEFFGSRDPDN